MTDLPYVTIPKNNSEEVRVSLSDYKGHRRVDVRIFAELRGGQGERIPTPKGVSLKAEKIADLIAALQQLQVEADVAGSGQ